MVNKIRYIIITPVRDEEKYIEKTIESVMSQTIKPVKWIIVNDGSTDNTRAIIDYYAKNIGWIYAIHRENRGFRKPGGGVVEAFYDGYQSSHSQDYHFIVKLDGDLSFDSDYFENCFKHFKINKKLGIGGGSIYYKVNGRFILESNPKFHVRGASKIYRRECWDAIGGLINAPGWDTLDEVKANMLGWTTQSFLELKIIQNRPTGAAEGVWRNAIKDGMANYVAGYHPLFMLIKCLRRALRKPLFSSGVGHFYGFLSGYIKRIPQVDDKDLIVYLRGQQIRRLFLMPSIWK